MEKWTLNKVKSGLENFFEANGRYPTATEFSEYDKLPSVKTIERKYGGIVKLRKTLKLSGDTDFRSGKYSSKRALKIYQRAHKINKEVYLYLLDQFGKKFVHQEYLFTDDSRTKTDFYIYCKTGNFSVDVFYPNNRRNLIGCLNSKLRTYSNSALRQYPVIFLSMNQKLGKDVLLGVLNNKKNKLEDNQHLMTFQMFREFCSTKRKN